VPYRFDFDPFNRIARCSLEGRIGAEEVKKCYQDAADFFAITDAHAGIFDLTGVVSLDFPTQTVRELAKRPPVLPNPDRIRVAIAPAPAVFGVARMFELLTDKTRPNLHIVRTAQEAWAILCVLEPQFKPYKP